MNPDSEPSKGDAEGLRRFTDDISGQILRAVHIAHHNYGADGGLSFTTSLIASIVGTYVTNALKSGVYGPLNAEAIQAVTSMIHDCVSQGIKQSNKVLNFQHFDLIVDDIYKPKYVPDSSVVVKREEF